MNFTIVFFIDFFAYISQQSFVHPYTKICAVILEDMALY